MREIPADPSSQELARAAPAEPEGRDDVVSRTRPVAGAGGGPVPSRSFLPFALPVGSAPAQLDPLDRASWDEKDPAGDARVQWLLAELNSICSSRALHHLCLDLLYERQGGRGRVALPTDDLERHRPDAILQLSDADAGLHEEGTRLAWKGLLAMWNASKSERKAGKAADDVSRLLEVLAACPELADKFGSQWPIKAIVDFLNTNSDGRRWIQRDVDEAKQTLGKWIARQKCSLGIEDFVDFEAVMVGVGRRLEEEQAKQAKQVASWAPNTPSGRAREGGA